MTGNQLHELVETSARAGHLDQRSWQARAVVTLAVLLAIAMLCLRQVNLGKMYFWNDEAATLDACAQRPYTDLHKFYSEVKRSYDFRTYVTERRVGSLLESVESLRAHLPEHTPLYYLLARTFAWQFGNTIENLRFVASLVSVAQIPLVAWICLEAFGGVLIPSLAVMFVAVSPHYFLYAREAREYSTWACTTMLSTALLLRALRTHTRSAWCMFGVAQVLLFQSHFAALLFFALLAIPIARNKQNLKRYVLASLPGLLLCAAWLAFLGNTVVKKNALTTWLTEPVSKLSVVQENIANYARLIADFAFNIHLQEYVAVAVVCLLLVTLVCFMRRGTPFRALVGSVLIGYPLVLIAADLIFGGVRSLQIRYQTPAVAYFYLALAYVLGTGISSTRIPIRLISIASTLLIIIAGIWSCVSYTNTQFCWIKYLAIEQRVASALGSNPGDNTLCLAGNAHRALVLSQLVPDSTQVECVPPNTKINMPEGVSKVVTLDSTDRLKSALETLGWNQQPDSKVFTKGREFKSP